MVRELWRRLLGSDPPGRAPSGRDAPVDAGAEAIAAEARESAALAYATTLLSEAREELGRADQKASILLATVSVVAAVVLSGILAADWTPMSLTTPWRESWFGGAVSVAIGVGALISAVYPRTSHGRDDEAALFYFGHAASVADVGQLQDEIRRFADDPLRRAADQLWRVSRVVGRKYHLIRIATWALGAGAAVMLAAGVAGAWGPCPLS